MADARRDRRARLTIGTAQLLLVVAAVGLWAASRLPWVVIRSLSLTARATEAGPGGTRSKAKRPSASAVARELN